MPTEIQFGGKPLRVRVSARTPWDYRELFFADIFDDMHRVCSGEAGADTLGVIERFLWLCARNAGEEVHAELPVDDAVPAWLDEYDDLYASMRVMPQVIQLWKDATKITSEAKKKTGNRPKVQRSAIHAPMLSAGNLLGDAGPSVDRSGLRHDDRSD